MLVKAPIIRYYTIVSHIQNSNFNSLFYGANLQNIQKLNICLFKTNLCNVEHKTCTDL